MLIPTNVVVTTDHAIDRMIMGFRSLVLMAAMLETVVSTIRAIDSALLSPSVRVRSDRIDFLQAIRDDRAGVMNPLIHGLFSLTHRILLNEI